MIMFAKVPLRNFLVGNNLFIFYSGIFCILFYGVAVAGTVNHLGYMLLYFSSLVLSYFFFLTRINKYQENIREIKDTIKRKAKLQYNCDILMWAFLALGLLFIANHLVYLEGIPAITAANIDNYYAIMHIRQDIFLAAPAHFRYIPNLLVKSIFPLSILYFFYNAKYKSMLAAILFGSFYALALMNKIFILLIFLPLIIFCCVTLRWFFLMAALVIPFVGITLLVFVQNPHIRPDIWQKYTIKLKSEPAYVAETARTINRIIEKHAIKAAQTEMAETRAAQAERAETGAAHVGKAETKNTQAGETEAVRSLLNSNEWMKATAKQTGSQVYNSLYTIYARIFLVPGQVITAWFKHVPSSIPFAEGNGYRIIAWLKNERFVFFPSLINDLEYPYLVEKGVHGTMTAANFMEDYANFGWKGLVLGGGILGLLLAFINKIFSSSWQLSLSINSVPLALIAESPLTTVMLTGGWALSVLLYIVFKKGMA